jgi:Fur family ferric uptake transcriptional regulator
MATKLSNTTQRRVIIDELAKHKGHPSADELYFVIRKKLPQISLATVYRNLELLAEAGLINKIELTGKQKRFDGIMDQHLHIRCPDCEAIENILPDEMDEIDKTLSELVRKLKGEKYRLEIEGLCPRCKVSRDKKGGKPVKVFNIPGLMAKKTLADARAALKIRPKSVVKPGRRSRSMKKKAR